MFLHLYAENNILFYFILCVLYYFNSIYIICFAQCLFVVWIGGGDGQLTTSEGSRKLMATIRMCFKWIAKTQNDKRSLARGSTINLQTKQHNHRAWDDK